MSDWKPIATAPKDGKTVLLWCPPDCVTRTPSAGRLWLVWFEQKMGEWVIPLYETASASNYWLDNIRPAYWMEAPPAPLDYDNAGQGSDGKEIEEWMNRKRAEGTW